jgi:hypothetical protein
MHLCGAKQMNQSKRGPPQRWHMVFVGNRVMMSAAG